MPICFNLHEGQSYFSTEWTGSVLNDEMVSAYRDFLAGSGIRKIYREYAAFSSVDLSEITYEGLKQLSKVISDYCAEQGITDARCASYIPRPVNHGLIQLYNYLSKQSPEATRVFTNEKEALGWLLSNEVNG